MLLGKLNVQLVADFERHCSDDSQPLLLQLHLQQAFLRVSQLRGDGGIAALCRLGHSICIRAKYERMHHDEVVLHGERLREIARQLRSRLEAPRRATAAYQRRRELELDAGSVSWRMKHPHCLLAQVLRWPLPTVAELSDQFRVVDAEERRVDIVERHMLLVQPVELADQARHRRGDDLPTRPGGRNHGDQAVVLAVHRETCRFPRSHGQREGSKTGRHWPSYFAVPAFTKSAPTTPPLRPTS